MGPTELSEALKGLEASNDPDLLVGYDTSDDAAVYRVTPEIALISTVDYITPPLNDPYGFGQIAAADLIVALKKLGAEASIKVGEVVAEERPYIRVV